MSFRLKLVVIVLVVLGVAIWRSAANAESGGNDGGDTVSVGVSTSSTSPGQPGRPATPARGRKGHAPKVQCTYVPLPDAQSGVLGAGGPTPGMWYLVKCPNQTGNPDIEHLAWVATGPNTAPPNAVAGSSADAAAAHAAASIVLPAPSIRLNPAAFSVVNFPSWLAIDPTLWHPFTATATAGGITASAVATPRNVTWNMGDGGIVTCAGPGTTFTASSPAANQTSSCSYSYKRSSDGQPSSDGNPNDGAFQVTATVTWTVTWAAIGEPGGGTLPSLQTTSRMALRVEQIESVGGGQ